MFLKFFQNSLASFHASMRSQMFYNIDVLEIFSKFTCFISRKYAFTDVLQHRCSWNFFKIHRKTPVPDSLDYCTYIFLIIFSKVLGTHFFCITSLKDCFCFQFNLLTVLRRFCFRTDQYLFKIPSYFRVYQNSSPLANWVSILFFT